ncbi:MAG TPA: PIN domain-containing protein [Candidatus Angelobacter sp.]
MNGSLLIPRRFLLDTNVMVGLRNRDRSITQRITPEMDLYLPSIGLGEMFSGAHRSDRVRENFEAIKALSKMFPTLSCDSGTAEAYGVLHAYLLNKGRPIPENDVWIAAIAHQRHLTLITRDSHFQYIDFLSLLMW